MDILKVLDTCRNIGTILKTARVIQSNISAEELHQKSGIAESTILKIENGGDAKFSTILKLFDTLNKIVKKGE